MAGLLALPIAVRAERITASSTTTEQGRQDPRDGAVHTVVPFLEMVSVQASDVANPVLDDMAIVASAWGEAVAYEPWDGKHLLGDVDAAYMAQRRVLGHERRVPGSGRVVKLSSAQLIEFTSTRLGRCFANGAADVEFRHGRRRPDCVCDVPFSRRCVLPLFNACALC